MTSKDTMHSTGTFPPFYLKNWEIKSTDEDYQLIRTFELANYWDARQFAAKVIEIGRSLKQMPTVYIYKQWVCVVCRVIRPDGLHLDDVVLPTSIDDIYANWDSKSVAAVA